MLSFQKGTAENTSVVPSEKEQQKMQVLFLQKKEQQKTKVLFL